MPAEAPKRNRCRLCQLLCFVVLQLPYLAVAFPAYDHIHFKQISTTDGLPGGEARAIFQDKSGFIWIGTQKGLSRFDGRQFNIFTHDSTNSDSISDDHVTGIESDRQGRLWIATTDGLNRYDWSAEKFIRFKQPTTGPNSEYINHITSLESDLQGGLWVGTAGAGLFYFSLEEESYTRLVLPDTPLLKRDLIHLRALCLGADGTLWIGTLNGGLFAYHSDTKEFRHFINNSSNPNSLPGNSVRTVLETNDGTLWLGTDNGIGRLNTETMQFATFSPGPSSAGGLSSRYIDSLIQDKEGNIWIGTDGGGLNVWDPTKERFRTYHSHPYDHSTISSDVIRTILEDNAGDLWLAHFPSGLSYANRLNAGFHIKQNSPTGPDSLSHESVKAFAEDSLGHVWISTDGGGLNYWNRTTDTFTLVQHDPNSKNSLSAQEVLGIGIESTDTLWAGTWQQGLNQYNPTDGSVTRYHEGPANTPSLSNPNIFSLLVDSTDTVWAGSLIGLNRFNRSDGTFTHFFPIEGDPNSISNHEIWTIHEGSNQVIWIGTRKGVNRYNPRTDTFTRFPPRENEPTGLRDSWISAILEDSEGRMWLGTHGAGLQSFQPEGNTYKAITEKDGLADNFICGILEDEQGKLWISTYSGISTYDPISREIRSFSKANGLPEAQFNRFTAHYKLSDGTLLFGSTKGFVWFKPEEIEKNEIAPRVQFTSLFILNNPVSPGTSESPLSKSISETNELRLAPEHTLVRFGFSAPVYRAADKTRVFFKMDKLDSTWRDTGKDLAAEYANLPPGHFTLRAYAQNGDGVRGPEASLQITVLPSLWQSTWFRLLGFVFTGCVVFVWHRSRLNLIQKHNQELRERNLRLKQEITTRTVAETELKAAKQLAETSDKAKSMFLANMSHEIRTPLNGIIGVTDILQEEHLSPEHQEYVDIIQQSGNTLMILINDILDFSKVEGGEIELEKTDCDLIAILEDAIELGSLSIGEKRLDLVYFVAPDVPRHIETDPIRLRQILSNLISNAVKFTETGEVAIRVTIETSTDQSCKLAFSVHDTGIGIAEESLPRLFKSFSQVDASTTRKYGGTGLGLAISKRLTELFNGTISVESKVGEGSTFCFSILTKRVSSPAEPAPETGQQPTNLEGANILLVDGNETRQEWIQSLATVQGFNLHLIESARDASNLQRRFCAAFDAILFDAETQIDEHSLLSLFKSQNPSQNTFLAIEPGGAAMGSQSDESVMILEIQKPLRQEKLLRTLSKLIEAKKSPKKLY